MKVVETAKLVEASDCWLQTVVMDDQAENSRKFEDRHVPAALVPDWNQYCPLVPIWGFEEDGVFYDCSGPEGDRGRKFELSQTITNPGILVVELGHIQRDSTVQSAASALHASLTSLFLPCGGDVDFEQMRTTSELSQVLRVYRPNYSHIVLIGHGSRDGIQFMDQSTPVKGRELAGLLGPDGSDRPVQLISLCCHSGCKELASGLSEDRTISEVIAPAESFDMRWSVHFVIGYFLQLYLNGKSVEDAVSAAVMNQKETPMCVWRDGEMVGACATD